MLPVKSIWDNTSAAFKDEHTFVEDMAAKMLAKNLQCHESWSKPPELAKFSVAHCVTLNLQHVDLTVLNRPASLSKYDMLVCR